MKLTVLKLAADGSNWKLYQEHIINTITPKKLRRYVIGTAHVPVVLVECDNSFWDDNSLFPLLGKQIEEHENVMEDWLQKEAMVCEIIYATVDQSTFHQIKGKPTAAAVWKKLTSIHSDRGAILAVLKGHYTEISCPISDASYVSYIHTSLFLAPSYKPLIMTIFTNSHVTGKSISSKDLIWHINEEANNAAVESSINQHHKAMVTAHAKTKGKLKNAKEKAKSKGKGKDKHHCDNCRKHRYTSDQCFEEDGGMAGKAPDLWVKKHKGKGRDKVKSANAVETDKKSDKNYTFLTFIPTDTPNNPANKNVALTITSGHSHEAHAHLHLLA
ncbi:hypothetical protein C0995_004775 [Termitomyces sp. Mi166|nr:hypothetical protein C0995_004775 [Termitomyces sp. Mi166\